jgi:hypothetical protein
MDHIGNPSCCCEPPPENPCAECCEPSGISFYMQYNNVDYPEYINCTSCDLDPFLVTLNPIECDIDCTEDPYDCDFTSVNNFISFISEDFCGETTTFRDEWVCTDAVEAILLLDCVKVCYETEFTGPCFTCEPDGVLSTEPFAGQVEYTIRALTAYNPLIQSDCFTIIAILRKFYCTDDVTSCEGLTLTKIDISHYYLLGDCCGTRSMPSESAYCSWTCATFDCIRFGCAATPAAATIPNPEWGEVTVSC